MIVDGMGRFSIFARFAFATICHGARKGIVIHVAWLSEMSAKSRSRGHQIRKFSTLGNCFDYIYAINPLYWNNCEIYIVR